LTHASVTLNLLSKESICFSVGATACGFRFQHGPHDSSGIMLMIMCLCKTIKTQQQNENSGISFDFLSFTT
jgi:hypothetical protein